MPSGWCCGRCWPVLARLEGIWELSMARVAERLAANVDGPFYVDASCIDCGTCWQFDPAHFAPTGSSSHVRAQPEGEEETRSALLALQADR